MNEKEEMIYSSMGFDPILLLEEPPLSENYTVNIIRPGSKISVEKSDEILKETQENTLITSNTKREENHKDINRQKNNPIEQKPTNTEETKNAEEEEEEENINVDLDEDTNELSSTELQEVNEDPRRKRRRSSASS